MNAPHTIIKTLDGTVGTRLIGSRFLGLSHPESDWDYMISAEDFRRSGIDISEAKTFKYYGFSCVHKLYTWGNVQLVILSQKDFDKQSADNRKVKTFLSHFDTVENIIDIKRDAKEHHKISGSSFFRMLVWLADFPVYSYKDADVFFYFKLFQFLSRMDYTEKELFTIQRIVYQLTPGNGLA